MRWHRLGGSSRPPTKTGADRISQAGAFLDFFESDTLVHFREEEESIFPLVIDSPEARPPLTRLLLEHVQLHALITTLRTELADSDPSAVTMTRIASLLQEHIRFEEKVLFPLVELLALDALASVELSPRERGSAARADT